MALAPRSPSSKRTVPGNRRTLYQAVLILLEASQRHILRYAALAEEMAGHCQDPQRQQELLTIAAISRHNAQHRPTDFPCQLFWYMNIILQYESNASLDFTPDAFDQYMLPFYQASLNQGQDPAYLKELLESLWVKCNDIVLLRSSSSARYFAGFPTGYTCPARRADGHRAQRGQCFVIFMPRRLSKRSAARSRIWACGSTS